MDWRSYSILLAILCASYATTVPGNDVRHIEFSGRIDLASVPNAAVFDWPCVSATVFVSNSSYVKVRVNGGHNRFQILVNGANGGILTMDNTEATYVVVAGLSMNSVNAVTLHKLTEASFFIAKIAMPLDPVILVNFEVEDGGIFHSIPESALPKRKMEFFGDSDSNGFGITGVDSTLGNIECLADLLKYENCYQGYPSQLATAFQADFRVEAWSGKGVVKNAEGIFPYSNQAMPIYWNRTIASDAHSNWDFGRFHPDVVLVHLGSNDYSNPPYPDTFTFIAAYEAMLVHILQSYQYDDQLSIITLCGGELGQDSMPCPHVQVATDRFKQNHHVRSWYVEIPDFLHAPEDFGCLGHRNVQGQTKVAQYLQPLLADILNWQ
eukprot:TRINITY_DN8887_c0_g1_i1.p1 TRINITY_DN8887_c0_g1~~TRINITY_DN8887_c0_g1_i1.p1  ORF type:complete len:380 (+),score=46.31 TRINITY_DN8887_c0_g1_i1:45-1184(+)